MFIAPLLLQAVPALAAVPLAQQEEPQVRDLLLVFTEGESLFVDPKDQAMLRALQLLDDRMAELPAELPDFPRELATFLPLISRLASGPMTLRVSAWEGMDPAMGPPVFAQLTLNENSPEAAQAMAAQLTEMLVATGMPQPQVDESGRIVVPAPLPVWYGVSGSDLLVTIGQSDEGQLIPGETGLPEGVDPKLAVSFEYGEMLEMLSGFAAMSGDMEAMQAFDMFDSLGLLDYSLQMAYGTDDERGYTVLSMPGYGAKLRESGLISDRTLTAGDLARVPADATWAQVSSINFSGILDLYMGMFEQIMADQGMSGDPMEMVRAQLGFDPQADLLAHLGSVCGIYTSDTTGGSSVLSMVAFCEMQDGEAFETTMAQLKGMANAIASMQAMGYVRFQDWQDGETGYTTLTFPGLPVPLEVTYAIDNGFLYAGMTPQTVMSAVAQGRAQNGGLLANQRFTGNMAGGMEGLASVNFIDTPRLLADGYGMALLFGSALRNATRSPQDDTRDAGMVIPTFPVLVNGALATVGTTRYLGDDVVTESRGDRSMVVGMVGGVGMLINSPLTPMLLAGLAAGGFAAYEEQQNSAMIEAWTEAPGDFDYEEEDEDY